MLDFLFLLHSKKIMDFVISLQGPIAENMIRESIEKGLWVFFQNCHLAPSWMPSLERLIEQINPERVGIQYLNQESSSLSSSFYRVSR